MNAAYDVLIIGGGPAGLSAALVLGRCARKVLLCDDGHPRNAPSNAMHGFLSRDHFPPQEFLRAAREDVARYDTVTLRDIEVLDVTRTGGGFEATLAGGEVVAAKKLLLATGMVDELPPIKGLRERWGRSVFPCPFCDAWEFRQRPLAVYGCGSSDATDFVLEMLTWTRDLTLLTDGSNPPCAGNCEKLERLGVRLEIRRVRELAGEGPTLQEIHFEEGAPLRCEALFLANTQHQRTAFAEKLGCAFVLDDGTVRTDELQRGRQRGVCVAGNAAAGLQSAIIATAEGFKAAYALNDELVEDLVAELTNTEPNSASSYGCGSAGDLQVRTSRQP